MTSFCDVDFDPLWLPDSIKDELCEFPPTLKRTKTSRFFPSVIREDALHPSPTLLSFMHPQEKEAEELDLSLHLDSEPESETMHDIDSTTDYKQWLDQKEDLMLPTGLSKPVLFRSVRQCISLDLQSRVDSAFKRKKTPDSLKLISGMQTLSDLIETMHEKSIQEIVRAIQAKFVRTRFTFTQSMQLLCLYYKNGKQVGQAVEVFIRHLKGPRYVFKRIIGDISAIE